MIKTIGQLAGGAEQGFLKMWETNVDPATRIWQDHRHGNFEIAMVVSGSGVYQTVGGVVPIEPGDVFVFPSNEPHWILEIRKEGLKIINLHFDRRLFQTACSVSRTYPNLFFAHSPTFSTRISAERAGDICRLMEAIRRELEGDARERQLFVHGHLGMIFAVLLRHHCYYSPEEGTHTAAAKIQNSLRYIDEHFAEDITLEGIAAESGLSPYYFTRLFRECFQIKLWDHVLSRRIDAAKKLLSEAGEMTVLEIALSCGFHNTANFNRAFLRLTGLTPSEYKKGGSIH